MRLESTLLFFVALTLTALGIIMAYNAGAVVGAERFGDAYFFLRRMAVYGVLGLVALGIGLKLDYHLWLQYRAPLLVGVVVLLVLVLVPGIGHAAMGARRWLRIGPFGMQPSEIAKVALVIFFAGYCAMRQEDLNDLWHGVVPAFALMGAVAGLVAAERDLGTPVAITIITMGVLFVGGMRARYLLGMLGSALPAVAILIAMEPYRLRRLVVFADPWRDPQGAGWQVVQSLLAFGSGGVMGVGWGQGVQKLLYLPEAHSDFVFAIIGEESGLLGTYAIVGMFLLLAAIGAKIALRAEDQGGAFLAMGLTFMLAAGAGMNMAVATGLVPPKGIPLPFISYGGTALIMSLFSVGVLMNIALSVRPSIISARAECA